MSEWGNPADYVGYLRTQERTQGSETSQYLEEQKAIWLVACSWFSGCW